MKRFTSLFSKHRKCTCTKVKTPQIPSDIKSAIIKSRIITHWDAEMILDAIVNLSVIDGYSIYLHNCKDKANPAFIKRQRLNAALAAFGKSLNDFGQDKTLFNPSILIDYDLPKNKELEIKEKLKILSGSNPSLNVFDGISTITYIFRWLFELYIRLCHACKLFHGIIECSREVGSQMDMVSQIVNVNIAPGVKKIRELLLLMMSATYENPVAVEKLIDEYGYPDITEEELYEMEIEWEC